MQWCEPTCQKTHLNAGVDRQIDDASWKLEMLSRTRHFLTDSVSATLYRAHLLAVSDNRKPADRVQIQFLDDAGLSQADALMSLT